MSNIRVRLIILCIIFLNIHPVCAQGDNRKSSDSIPARNGMLGLHLILSDFNRPYFKNPIAGYQLSYLNGVSSSLSYMAQAGSIASATDSDNRSNPANSVLHYLQVSTLFYPDPRQRSIDPFISMGAGINFAHPYIAPFIMSGVGMQMKVLKNTMLHIQANYEICTGNRINNSLQLNAGLLGTVFTHKKKVRSKSAYTIITEVKETDTDGDGIPDSKDSCITIPGPKAFNGCPDSDGDGIPDHLDKCPLAPGYVAYQGCPIPDTDGDGINDLNDRCPGEPGPASTNGCPVKVEQVEQQLKVLALRVQFAVNKYELQDSTKELLKEVVKILKQHPSIYLIVEGHTDNSGNPSINQVLSVNRAFAVADYLTSEGISAERISHAGFGQSKPIISNDSPAGKRANRRTEFRISVRHTN